jgi:hypothetical protein
LCNQELQNSNFSPCISINIKATIGWDGHMARTEELNNAYDASVKSAVGRTDLKETQCWVGDYYKAS